MKFFNLVWRNLTRKKLRTVLTVGSIFVAFLLFGFLATIREAFVAGVSMADADRLIVRHKVSLIQLVPLAYKARIERIPGVASATHQTWFGGIYRDPKNFFPSMPCEPEEFLAMYPEYALPAEQKQAWLSNRTGAIVGRVTAERFGWKVGDRITLRSPIWQRGNRNDSWEFDLVGIYDAAKPNVDLSLFLSRYDYLDEGRLFGKGLVGWYVVRVKDQSRAAEVARAIDDEFANSPCETKSEGEGAFMAGFAQQIGDIGTIMLGILSAVFFTIMLVAGNTMAQSVRERTEEIGVLKAMGFTNELVLGVVLAESVLIAAVGGLAGLGVASALISQGSPAPGMLPVWYLPGRDLLFGIACVFGLGVAAGIFPALQAMRIGISEALRRQT